MWAYGLMYTASSTLRMLQHTIMRSPVHACDIRKVHSQIFMFAQQPLQSELPLSRMLRVHADGEPCGDWRRGPGRLVRVGLQGLDCRQHMVGMTANVCVERAMLPCTLVAIENAFAYGNAGLSQVYASVCCRYHTAAHIATSTSTSAFACNGMWGVNENTLVKGKGRLQACVYMSA
jgi:hypothetical protein